MSDTPPPPSAPGQGDPQAPTPPAPPSQSYSAPPAPGYGAPAQGHHPPAPGYGAPPAGYAPVAPARTNPLAIAALATACGGVIIWILAPIAGAIMGHIALRQIKRTGENGRGMALAGVLVGWILGGLQLIGVVAYVIFIIIAFATVGAGAGFYSN